MSVAGSSWCWAAGLLSRVVYSRLDYSFPRSNGPCLGLLHV